MADIGPTITASSSKRKSRAISSLTQQQRQHKRDLDRKAQRALRERTKTRLQDLEIELSTLEKRNTEQKAALEAELTLLRQANRNLHSRLGQIRHLAAVDFARTHNVISNPALRQASRVSDDLDCITVNAGSSNRSLSTSTSRSSELENDSVQGDDPITEADALAKYPNTVENHLAVDRDDDIYNRAIHDMNPTVISHNTQNSTQRDRIQASHTTVENYGSFSDATAAYLASPAATTQTQFTSNYDRDHYLDGTHTQVAIVSPISNARHASAVSNPVGNSNSVNSFLPRHLSATCPLDQILIDFLASRRALAAAGTPLEIVVGGNDPYVAAILEPSLAITAHPISRVMAEILSTFPHVAIQERIAFMYLMHRTMKWQVSPTRGNYDCLPTWLRPTVTQITVAHAPWIDNIPWPGVRDMLIDSPDLYPFERFSDIYSANVTINWPYEVMDAVTKSGLGTGEYGLNSIFEKHIQKLSNWTVSSQFEVLLPEMRSAIHSRG